MLPDSKRYLYLPKRRALPADRYRMSENGLLLREDIIDTAYVEETYVTPRNFLFQMNKLSGERDLEEQRQENSTPPVTVESIETGVPDFDAQQLKITEQGKVDRKRMTDIELCAIVDTQFVPRYCKRELSASIYQLSESQRAGICEILGIFRIELVSVAVPFGDICAAVHFISQGSFLKLAVICAKSRLLCSR